MDFLTSGTFWTAVGTLGTLAGLALTYSHRLKLRRRKRKYSLFLSMQMVNLQSSEYEQVRHDIMQVVYWLRNHPKVRKVFFYNESLQREEDFDYSSFDAEKYVTEINECDFFVCVMSERVFSSIYFEAGYAITCGCRSVYFFTKENVMPSVMRKLAEERTEIQVFKTADLAEIKRTLDNILNLAGERA